MKTHYSIYCNTRPGSHGRAVCNRNRKLQVSHNPDDVTCKRCRDMQNLDEREDRMPCCGGDWRQFA